MIEVIGNFWNTPAPWKCIPTNTSIRKNGEAFMLQGVGKEACDRIPGIAKHLAADITTYGNIVQGICTYEEVFYIAFPEREQWKDGIDPDILIDSAHHLLEHWLNHGQGCNVLIPKPDVDISDWRAIKPYLSGILREPQFKLVRYTHTSVIPDRDDSFAQVPPPVTDPITHQKFMEL